MEVKQGMLVRERLVFPRRGYQELRTGLLALLLGERTLLGAPGIATTSILTTRNKNATCNKGIATRSKDATNGGSSIKNPLQASRTTLGLSQDSVTTVFSDLPAQDSSGVSRVKRLSSIT